MTGKLLSLKMPPEQKLQVFKDRCAKLASQGPRSFETHFLVSRSHQLSRSGDKNSSLQSSIQNEHIAAILIHGRINPATSRAEHPMELAIDGAFENFTYTEFMDSGPPGDKTLSRVEIRVAIKEGKPRIIIKSAHAIDSDPTIPKVPQHVW